MGIPRHGAKIGDQTHSGTATDGTDTLDSRHLVREQAGYRHDRPIGSLQPKAERRVPVVKKLERSDHSYPSGRPAENPGRPHQIRKAPLCPGWPGNGRGRTQCDPSHTHFYGTDETAYGRVGGCQPGRPADGFGQLVLVPGSSSLFGLPSGFRVHRFMVRDPVDAYYRDVLADYQAASGDRMQVTISVGRY